MTASRLLIVSNRLPVVARVVDGEVCVSDAGGGLATGLRPYHERSGGRWIGWPGDVSKMTPAQRHDLGEQLRQRAIVPVSLSRDHTERFYNGFANRVLWPLFNYA
jgi:trehalose 6-phosphate synthase/phosphatase